MYFSHLFYKIRISNLKILFLDSFCMIERSADTCITYNLNFARIQ